MARRVVMEFTHEQYDRMVLALRTYEAKVLRLSGFIAAFESDQDIRHCDETAYHIWNNRPSRYAEGIRFVMGQGFKPTPAHAIWRYVEMLDGHT